MTAIIGALHGQEETFPPALVSEINARDTPFRARMIQIGGAEISEESAFRVLVDRISHKVPFYRSFLKQQALLGTYCLHNPFWMESVDRLVVSQLAQIARVPTPTTILLPTRDHPPGVVNEDLENLAYPLPWEYILETVGLPALLRPAALGRRDFLVIEHLGELWDVFARTGSELHVIQSVTHSSERRLVLVAGEETRTLALDPESSRYRIDEKVDPGWAVEAGKLALAFCHSAALDLAGIELALSAKGQPVLVDVHLFPDLDWWSLSEDAFAWVVGATADIVLQRAAEPPHSAILGLPTRKPGRKARVK
jgi:hypothetical protein